MIPRKRTNQRLGRAGQVTASTRAQAKLCVCYVLSYRAPDYIRTQSILHAMAMCPNVRVVVARNTHKGLRRYFETWRALSQVHASEPPDVYIVGFRGHEIFWFVRWAARRKPVVLDALMSPYAALCEERKAGLLGSLIAPIVGRLERRVLSAASAVLTDTRLHASYYAKTFGIPLEKILRIPVGAVETIPSKQFARPSAAEGDFNALFYGSFLALHGIDVVVEAASHLKDLPIRFDFIGGRAPQARRLQRMCAQKGVTRYTYRRWAPFARLIEMDIPCASVCLGGPFGGTPQARRVVTGKTSQCLALGKATVIGKIDEDCGFKDRVNCLLVEQNNAAALSEALRWAYENRFLLDEIGARGQQLYYDRLSVKVIADALPALFRIVDAKSV